MTTNCSTASGARPSSPRRRDREAGNAASWCRPAPTAPHVAASTRHTDPHPTWSSP
jgi:hypothetical protein